MLKNADVQSLNLGFRFARLVCVISKISNRYPIGAYIDKYQAFA